MPRLPGFQCEPIEMHRNYRTPDRQQAQAAMSTSSSLSPLSSLDPAPACASLSRSCSSEFAFKSDNHHTRLQASRHQPMSSYNSVKTSLEAAAHHKPQGPSGLCLLDRQHSEFETHLLRTSQIVKDSFHSSFPDRIRDSFDNAEDASRSIKIIKESKAHVQQKVLRSIAASKPAIIAHIVRAKPTSKAMPWHKTTADKSTRLRTSKRQPEPAVNNTLELTHPAEPKAHTTPEKLASPVKSPKSIKANVHSDKTNTKRPSDPAADRSAKRAKLVSHVDAEIVTTSAFERPSNRSLVACPLAEDDAKHRHLQPSSQIMPSNQSGKTLAVVTPAPREIRNRTPLAKQELHSTKTGEAAKLFKPGSVRDQLLTMLSSPAPRSMQQQVSAEQVVRSRQEAHWLSRGNRDHRSQLLDQSRLLADSGTPSSRSPLMALDRNRQIHTLSLSKVPSVVMNLSPLQIKRKRDMLDSGMPSKLQKPTEVPISTTCHSDEVGDVHGSPKKSGSDRQSLLQTLIDISTKLVARLDQREMELQDFGEAYLCQGRSIIQSTQSDHDAAVGQFDEVVGQAQAQARQAMEQTLQNIREITRGRGEKGANDAPTN